MFAGKSDPVKELYDLDADVGEQVNVYDKHPDVVADLMTALDAARQDLGDSIAAVEGQGCRPIGRVDDPQPLAVYSPDHPYIVAAYDTPDTDVMAG